MIFQCQKEVLLNTLNIVSKAVSPKASMPILEGIYINAGPEQIKIVGNDLELGIECNIGAEVYEEGSIVLLSKTFTEIVRKLPNDTVTVKAQAADTIGEIKSVEYYKTDADVVLSTADLEALAASEWTKYAEFDVAADEQFTVYLKVTDYANNVTFISSDGYIVEDDEEPIERGRGRAKDKVPPSKK
jgi:hypothetical protein